MITGLLVCVALAATSVSGSHRSLWIPTRIPSMSYPVLALEAQISGTVVLRIKVNSDGAVADVRIRSGHPVLAKAAQKNMGAWRFTALLSGPAKSETEMEFTYLFKLEGEAITAPPTEFVYEYPDKVIVTSKPLHWMP